MVIFWAFRPFGQKAESARLSAVFSLAGLINEVPIRQGRGLFIKKRLSVVLKFHVGLPTKWGKGESYSEKQEPIERRFELRGYATRQWIAWHHSRVPGREAIFPGEAIYNDVSKNDEYGEALYEPLPVSSGRRDSQ